MVKALEAAAGHETNGPLRTTANALLRERLARKIDMTALRVPKARILSLGCGHLREASSSAAFAQLRLGMFAVLDPDRSALAEMARAHGNVPGLVLLGGTVRDLLTGVLAPSGFDLVYTAGLYDQLPHPVASALTAVLVQALNPNGELVVATFARKQAALRSLCSIVPRDETISLETFADETGCVSYLELVRA